MSIAQSILPEFDHEMANTRRTIERIPDDKLNWQAHPRSNTIGWVATHLAELPQWVEGTLAGDSHDVAPGGKPETVEPLKSTQQILAMFDQNTATARKLIASTDDERFAQPWTLLENGKQLFTMPRIAVLRSFVLNHSIHHRAILCVYLRLNDIPVPALYGPSGDEQT